MLELADIQSGSRVLDVATGGGEPALTAAHRVGASGNHAVLYQASLTSATSGWDCMTYDTNNTPFPSADTCTFQSDGYHLSVPNGYAYTGSALTTQTYENAVIEVTYTILTASQQGYAVAIAFRKQQSDRSQFYALDLSPDGHYELFVVPSSLPHETILIQDVPSSFIQQGINQPNRIKIVMNGPRFTLYANGQQLTSPVTDSTFSVGYIALAAIGAGTEVVFSNLTVTSP